MNVNYFWRKLLILSVATIALVVISSMLSFPKHNTYPSLRDKAKLIHIGDNKTTVLRILGKPDLKPLMVTEGIPSIKDPLMWQWLSEKTKSKESIEAIANYDFRGGRLDADVIITFDNYGNVRKIIVVRQPIFSKYLPDFGWLRCDRK